MAKGIYLREEVGFKAPATKKDTKKKTAKDNKKK